MFKFKMTYNMILNCLQIFLKETSRCDFFPALLVYTIVWITTLEMSWQMVKVVHIIMQKKNKYNKAVVIQTFLKEHLNNSKNKLSKDTECHFQEPLS